ncbi:MAG: YfjI family protein [Fuerstiella sp.]
MSLKTRLARPQNNGQPQAKPDDKTDNTPQNRVSSVLSSNFADWPEPAALTGPEPEAMTADDFPGFVGDIVRAVAENSETPVALPGLVALGILATACQQRFEIACDGQHTEPLNLWCCPSLESGNRKTAVLNELAKPVREFERRMRAENAETLRQSESMRRTLEKRVENLRTKAARAADRQQMDEFQREIDAVERELPPVVFPPTLLADDCTPEHIATLLSHHGERLTVLSDEAGVFELMAGRYSRGVSNLDVYLQSHAGSPVRVDRGSRPSIDLEKPCLSIVVSPQPSVLEDIGQRKDFVGRGLLARFLFAVPQSKLGFRSHQPQPIPRDVSERWSRAVQGMLAIDQRTNKFGKPAPHKLYLSPDAYRLWKSEQLSMEYDMRPGNTWFSQTAWASKYPGAVLRIAGVLHVALCVDQKRDAAAENVPGDTMNAAVRLGQKIKGHTLKTFGAMALNEDQRFARKVLEWIKRDDVERFTGREAAIHCNSAGSSKELEGSLLLLAERGWIRQAPKQKPEGGGRPSQPWDVHPQIAKFTDKTDITPRESVSSVLSSTFEDARATRPEAEPESGNLADIEWTDDVF